MPQSLPWLGINKLHLPDIFATTARSREPLATAARAQPRIPPDFPDLPRPAAVPQAVTRTCGTKRHAWNMLGTGTS